MRRGGKEWRNGDLKSGKRERLEIDVFGALFCFGWMCV